jgi:hypothetical protein
LLFRPYGPSFGKQVFFQILHFWHEKSVIDKIGAPPLVFVLRTRTPPQRTACRAHIALRGDVTWRPSDALFFCPRVTAAFVTLQIPISVPKVRPDEAVAMRTNPALAHVSCAIDHFTHQAACTNHPPRPFLSSSYAGDGWTAQTVAVRCAKYGRFSTTRTLRRKRRFQ